MSKVAVIMGSKSDLPVMQDAIDILKGLKTEFQHHHALTYTDPALEEAAKLSSRFKTCALFSER